MQLEMVIGFEFMQSEIEKKKKQRTILCYSLINRVYDRKSYMLLLLLMLLFV